MAAEASSFWDPAAQSAIPGGAGNRALQVATCSLCGLERPTGLMLADGGEACDDLRWYCKDTRSCTQRWTSGLREPAAGTAQAEAKKATEASKASKASKATEATEARKATEAKEAETADCRT